MRPVMFVHAGVPCQRVAAHTFPVMADVRMTGTQTPFSFIPPAVATNGTIKHTPRHP